MKMDRVVGRTRNGVIIGSRALLVLLAVVLVVAVISKLLTDGLPAVAKKFQSWQDDRLLDRFAAMEAQRRVDASTSSHQPFRYVIEKCLAGDVQRIVKTVTAGCRGNVRVLAGNNEVLGHGDMLIATYSDASTQVRIDFGDTSDVFDAKELKSQ